MVVVYFFSIIKMIVVESDDINVIKEQRDQYKEQVERLTSLMTPLTTENTELKEQIEKLQYITII